MNTYAARDSRPTWKPRPYTQGQADLIKLMMSERDITPQMLVKVFPNRPQTQDDARKVIEWLKGQTKTVNSPAPTTPQYDGIAPKPEPGKRAQAFHYALRDEDGVVKFYRVKAGRKEGFYFVDAQASDEYYPIRNAAHRAAILDAINADRKAALALYGQELGRCGRCGRTLTSEYRQLGIGPVCIDK
jgi:hypothetical protein